jgi:hypothetical protein
MAQLDGILEEVRVAVYADFNAVGLVYEGVDVVTEFCGEAQEGRCLRVVV